MPHPQDTQHGTARRLPDGLRVHRKSFLNNVWSYLRRNRHILRQKPWNVPLPYLRIFKPCITPGPLDCRKACSCRFILIVQLGYPLPWMSSKGAWSNHCPHSGFMLTIRFTNCDSSHTSWVVCGTTHLKEWEWLIGRFSL